MNRAGGTPTNRERSHIRPRIRNNRLVKDQDPRVARDLLWLLALLVFLALPAIWGITQRDRFVRTGYEIEKLRDELARLEKEHQRLVIDRAAAEAAERVARRATEDLGLVDGSLGPRVLVPGPRPGAPRGAHEPRMAEIPPQDAALVVGEAPAGGGISARISDVGPGMAPAGGRR